MTKDQYNKLSGQILDAALTVHKEMGSGLLESVYESCLNQELQLRNIKVKSQVHTPLFYKGVELNKDYRIDILVENEIIIEIKAVEVILPVHEAQVISYLKPADKKLGFLINFNVPLVKNGFKRYINGYI
ncbi:MAG: GxxExxY protein [Bacteroidota bacterium]|jgi:GxxExxY protein